VFDLFVQSARTLDRSDGGLGVGLTLVRSLVTMHGGTVRAMSDGPGKGSTFELRLPLAASAVDPAAPARSAEAAREARGPRAGGAVTRVVVVEDNVDSAEMLCALLDLGGYRCDTASDGIAGLATIERVRPEVAFVDLGLPGIDGFEVARRVRAQPELAGVFLVALTGYGQATDRERTLEAGFDAHLVKPVDPDEVLRLLGGRRPGV
jgi:two-component system CheB/CheR fusion protein